MIHELSLPTTEEVATTDRGESDQPINSLKASMQLHIKFFTVNSAENAHSSSKQNLRRLMLDLTLTEAIAEILYLNPI